MRGMFITLEGMDGAGKSTHIPAIVDLLQARGKEVLVTREPGGTELGERLRELLLHETMQPETEALLMFAARRQHLVQLILPALARGTWVLSDRFTDASFAYQGEGRGVAVDKLRFLERWVQGDFQPDLTLLFDLPVSLSMERLACVRTPDRFECEDTAFFERIRCGYLQRAAEFPERFRVIDASKSLEEVNVEVKKYIISI